MELDEPREATQQEEQFATRSGKSPLTQQQLKLK